jgi:hypothetical protein
MKSVKEVALKELCPTGSTGLTGLFPAILKIAGKNEAAKRQETLIGMRGAAGGRTPQ